MEPSSFLMYPHAGIPEWFIFVRDAFDACGHGLQDRRVDSLTEAESKEGEMFVWVHSSFSDGRFPAVYEEINRLVALFHGLKVSLGLKDLISVLELSLEVGLEVFPCRPFVFLDEVFD
jgi:hypothetical protein